METLDVKGVRFRLEGLAPESRAYLEAKLRRRRRERSLLHRLVEALLPGDWRRLPVERLVSGRVLVIGCAGGIEALGLGAVAFDIDREALRVAADLRAHAVGASADFLAASAAAIPFRTGTFDAVLSDNVVEHLPEPQLMPHMSEVARVVRDRGRYVFTTPNGLFENPAKAGHVSLHSYAEWEERVKAAGFRKVLTPRRRSGELEGLDDKKAGEGRASAFRSRAWLSHRGLRMVTIVATR